MIKILNRGFISVTPKPSFYDEAAKEMDVDIVHFENPEPTIYLIEEDFWDNQSILKKHFKKTCSHTSKSLKSALFMEDLVHFQCSKIMAQMTQFQLMF